MALNEKFISADSHVVEPADLWIKRVSKAFFDRAPHFEEHADADSLIIEGIPPIQGVDLMANMADDKLKGRTLDRSRNHIRDESELVDQVVARRGANGYYQNVS